MTTLPSLLLELKILQAKIEQELKPKSKPLLQLFPQQINKNEYTDTIKDKYYLLTLTFDSKISCHLDEQGQHIQLRHCVDLIRNYQYYTCFEKHKSGILHAHIMIRIEDYHIFQSILHKMKKHLTKSVNLSPSINIKPVKDTSTDQWRTYSYIWDDKPDHPEYKYIIINI